MESRWRGANGETGGEAGDEYALFGSLPRETRGYRGPIGAMIKLKEGDFLKILQKNKSSSSAAAAAT